MLYHIWNWWILKIYLYCNLNSLEKKTTKVKKEKLLEEKEYQKNLQHLQALLEMA